MIKTNEDFEAIISIDEEKLIKKYGELPATFADKIAHSSQRNGVIIEQYMNNRDRYGKTLIFALNIFHCFTLCESLKAKGIKCDYIYSGNSNNDEKIRKFKENQLEVLVNVNILTEGSDVPDIQTIFLTRPTSSEGLLMQMIGRGLRGKYSGGTETAIIVDFCDKWDTFNKWLNPTWLFEKGGIEGVKAPRSYNYKKSFIPWDLIREIYQGISFKGKHGIHEELGLPIGWYALLDEQGEDYTMLVFKEQLSGFIELFKGVDRQGISLDTPQTNILNKYFSGFVMPPNKRDLELLLSNWRESSLRPHMFTFENRNSIDPITLATNFRMQNIGLLDLELQLQEIYDQRADLIKNIFGEYESFYNKVLDCLKTNSITAHAKIEELPIELIPFRLEPTYDLKQLKNEVVAEMFDSNYGDIEDIEWTDKPYNTYYGKYYGDGRIRINCLLNSEDVPRETVKFIIYHEMLHRDYWDHDKRFFEQEHKYPSYTEHNRFLDYGISNYKFQW